MQIAQLGSGDMPQTLDAAGVSTLAFTFGVGDAAVNLRCRKALSTFKPIFCAIAVEMPQTLDAARR